MSTSYAVMVDLERLRTRLQASAGTASEDPTTYLKAGGFVATDDPRVWKAPLSIIDLLWPEEIERIESR